MQQLAPAGTGSSLPNRLFTRDFLLVCLASFLCFIVDYSYLVTLPVYLVILGGEIGQAGLVTAASSIIQVICAPQLGRYVGRFGRTTFMGIGMALLLVVALILQITSGLLLLVAVGALIGAGLAFFQMGATTLAADLAPVPRRGQAMGVLGSFIVSSVAISPTVFTFVMQNSGFSALFGVSATLAAAALVLTRFIREPARPADIPVSGRLYSPAALLPCLCMFAITMTYGTLVSFLPVQARAIDLPNVGLFFTVFALASLMVRVLAGTISDRVERPAVILPALLLVALTTFMLGQTQNPSLALVLAFLYGIGYGSAHPVILAMAVDRAGPRERAAAVATFNGSYSLGMATGSLTMGYLLSATSFTIMTATAAAVPFMAMVVLYLRRPRSASPINK